MKHTLFLFLILIQGFTSCNNQDNGDIRDLDIYLLIGQSNMAGRAEIEAQDMDTLQDVYLFRNDSVNVWEKAANPLNKYSTVRKKIEMQRLGPGYHFARHMKEFFPEKKIGLVVNARGGTSILKWMPGTEYYNEAVIQTRKAMEYGMLKGIVWHQGESDSRRPDMYLDSLTRMILALRKDFQNPDLPFVAGEISEDKPHRNVFNEMIVHLPEICTHTAVISTGGTTTFDSTHFDSGSQQLLGKRYAEKMYELLEALY